MLSGKILITTPSPKGIYIYKATFVPKEHNSSLNPIKPIFLFFSQYSGAWEKSSMNCEEEIEGFKDIMFNVANQNEIKQFTKKNNGV